MQFLITAYDYTDERAIERRLAAREQHLKGVEEMFKCGKHLYAVVILDENEKMIGSVITADFQSREELNEWLKLEPYVVNKVWEKIEVKPCKVGPMFMNLYKN
jgi:uncharacterized protein